MSLEKHSTPPIVRQRRRGGAPVSDPARSVHSPVHKDAAASTDSGKPPPAWFARAVAAPFEERFVEVEGCPIHYLLWGQAGNPGLLLVHGGFAHAHWWDFIAPVFADHYRVAAIDLSGMGDSGYRPKYSGETYAKEVMAASAGAGFGKAPVVVGHSFGGFVALKSGALYGEKLSGVVIVDFPIRPPELQRDYEDRRPQIRPKEIYPNRKAALERFRLIPAQPCENAFILEHIAARSLAKVNGGWSWKFDDQIFKGFELGNLSEDLPKVTCELAFIYGERSALFPREIVDYMSKLLRGRAPLIAIPKVHHHLFLDQPLVLVNALQKVLNDWQPRAATEVTSL